MPLLWLEQSCQSKQPRRAKNPTALAQRSRGSVNNFQMERYAREQALREQAMANQHQLATMAQSRQEKADIATKNNIRLVIISLLAAFLASLGYASFAKDSSLSKDVWTGVLGLLGGGGGTAALLQSRNEKEKDKF